MENLYHPVKIGNLQVAGNLFLAPIAGYSDRAFRCVCKENGADMCYTEMVSSEAIYHESVYAEKKTHKTDTLLLRNVADPIFAVQIFGGNEKSMYFATKQILKNYHPSLIDVNCGCPVPKIVKSGAGAELTRNPKKLFAIVKQVVKATNEFAADTGEKVIPVTVKIRSGWDENHLTWKEAASAACDAGVSAITLHARTRSQGYEGKAKWEILSELVQNFSAIPIFGSGDVFTSENAKQMLCSTGVDGVMFARGAMGNPFIFNQTKQFLQNGTYEAVSNQTKMQTAFKELKILIEDKGEEIACKEMRKRFCCYTKGMKNATKFRQRIVSAETLQDYVALSSQIMAE